MKRSLVVASLVLAPLLLLSGACKDEDTEPYRAPGSDYGYQTPSGQTATFHWWEMTRPTPTPGPGSFGSLPYDQRHTVCLEAAPIFEEDANGHAPPGRTWPTAKPTFYTKCMDCGGPTAVYSYVTEDSKLYIGCGGLSRPVIPAGATQFWP